MNTLYCQPNETPKSNCNSQHNANAQESLNTNSNSHDKNLNDQINKNIQVDNKRNSPITDGSAITNTNTNTQSNVNRQINNSPLLGYSSDETITQTTYNVRNTPSLDDIYPLTKIQKTRCFWDNIIYLEKLKNAEIPRIGGNIASNQAYLQNRINQIVMDTINMSSWNKLLYYRSYNNTDSATLELFKNMKYAHFCNTPVYYNGFYEVYDYSMYFDVFTVHKLAKVSDCNNIIDFYIKLFNTPFNA